MHDGVAVGACCAGVARLWDFEFLAQGGFELFANVFVFLQEDAGVIAALAHALAAKADPRTALFEQAFFDTEVDQVAFAGDTFTVENVEFGFAEGRGDFVLHHFAAGARTDDAVAFLDGLNAANVQANGSVELQRAAAGGGFRVTEHHADLFADLVDEDEAGARLGDDGGEFAQRLRHQARLQAHLRIAHFAFKLGFGDQGGDGVDHDDVDAAGANQRLGDFKGLLAVIGLRDEKVVDVHTEFAGVDGIERVLGVDERRGAAQLLRFGDDVQRHGGLTAGFRAVDFDDAAAREAAHAEGGVEREAARRDHTDGHQHVAAAQAHDGAFAVRLFDLRYRCFEHFCFIVCHFTPRWRKVGKLCCTTDRQGFAP